MVLAPMADVTDAAFRRIIAARGKPDVMWTEFVSADGLILAPEAGRQKLLRDLVYTEAERPIVAQFFTSNPENMRKVAELAAQLGFDGVDINMGCPDRTIEKQGAGAALMKDPALARALIRAAKEGASNLPISVKTRIGFNKVELETWLPEILKEEPAVVTIHARTRKEMSKVPARWEFVKRAVEIRDEAKSSTLIFGNGDVVDLDDARKKCEETGCDGVMLGRAIFGNPYLFAKEKYPEGAEGLKLRLNTLIEHTKLFEELLGDIKNFSIMKKHFKAYVSGFDGAAELRGKLMEANTAREVENIIQEFLH
jgi:nifR3 family TIM-barrel protein